MSRLRMRQAELRRRQAATEIDVDLLLRIAVDGARATTTGNNRELFMRRALAAWNDLTPCDCSYVDGRLLLEAGCAKHDPRKW